MSLLLDEEIQAFNGCPERENQSSLGMSFLIDFPIPSSHLQTYVHKSNTKWAKEVTHLRKRRREAEDVRGGEKGVEVM